VNAKNPLPQNFVPAVTDINAAYCRDPNFRFDSRAVDKLNAMCAAARNDGVKLLVISPYRSIQKQTELFTAKVAEYPNLPKAEAEAKAAQVVAAPGTSEHNLGLAVDFDSLVTSYENTANFKWLKNHAADYGFILRYPKDKLAVTGVSYEPWHYRYVGEYHAKQIKSKGICLEEYIDQLKAQQ
jgi:D-alanyl-D-alanine carboxypeptidase